MSFILKGATTGGFKNKIEKLVLAEWNSGLNRCKTFEESLVVRLQCAWRRRRARMLFVALQKKTQCEQYQKELQKGEFECEACQEGETDKYRADRIAFCAMERMLFENDSQILVHDTGDNWNARFQQALQMPQNTPLQRRARWHALGSVSKDFSAAAVTYGQIIISEYFLHIKDKSVKPKKVGGIAGGKKYLWRGILFKLADGSTGPWVGSDEAAAKAAGHDLRGASTYFSLNVPGLHYALVALIDYKGFRMTAQAWLPINKKSLKLGSSDGGITVQNSDPELFCLAQQTSQALNLKTHNVGKNGDQQMVFACDIEGHKAEDGRYYLLDFGRFMPPECPLEAGHLKHILPEGSKVKVPCGSGRSLLGVIMRTHEFGTVYDVYFPSRAETCQLQADQVREKRLSIFWRLMRPEFVKYRGQNLWEALGLDWPPSEAELKKLQDEHFQPFGLVNKKLSQDFEEPGQHQINIPNSFLDSKLAHETLANIHSADKEHSSSTQEWNLYNKPLSPDAYSSFSRHDKDFCTHNRDVKMATRFLLQAVVPKLAEYLIRITSDNEQATLELCICYELHRFGVNIRHCGLLRYHIPDYVRYRCLRDKLLIEMVARTLKNLFRDCQRKWMRSQQTTSEQGLYHLTASFINLVTGAHIPSEPFWERTVYLGVLQRFGHIGLTSWEWKNLKQLMFAPERMHRLMLLFCDIAGIQLDKRASNDFENDNSAQGFEFLSSDIAQIVPRVKYIHSIHFQRAELLSKEAYIRERQQLEAKSDDTLKTQRNEKLVARLRCKAEESYRVARRSLPDFPGSSHKVSEEERRISLKDEDACSSFSPIAPKKQQKLLRTTAMQRSELKVQVPVPSSQFTDKRALSDLLLPQKDPFACNSQRSPPRPNEMQDKHTSPEEFDGAVSQLSFSMGKINEERQSDVLSANSGPERSEPKSKRSPVPSARRNSLPVSQSVMPTPLLTSSQSQHTQDSESPFVKHIALKTLREYSSRMSLSPSPTYTPKHASAFNNH